MGHSNTKDYVSEIDSLKRQSRQALYDSPFPHKALYLLRKAYDIAEKYGDEKRRKALLVSITELEGW